MLITKYVVQPALKAKNRNAHAPWHVTWGQGVRNNHIFGIPDPDLSIIIQLLWGSGRGGATILRVGGTNITPNEASRKFFGLYPPHMPFWGVQQLQREAYGEPIGQHCYNILVVVLVQF